MEPYITLQQAKDHLRLDNDYNDTILEGLIHSVAPYIRQCTGLPYDVQKDMDLCVTTGLFLIRLWYYPEAGDSYRLRQVIDSLMITLKTYNY